MATLDIDGQLIGYAVEGTGTPLLLLHGTTMNRTTFDGMRAALPADAAYECVMVEFPGSGESAMPTEPLSVQVLAHQAHTVMQHLGHDRYHVAGYSLGAVVAAGLAGIQPDAMASVTLLAGWITTDARQRCTFELWKRLIATDKELFMRYALADGLTAGAHLMMEPILEMAIGMGAATVAEGSAAHLDLDLIVDIASLVGKITAPTLIIGGAEDRWVDISHSHALAAAIAGSRLEILPAGHLMITELPAEIAALLHAHIAAVN
ncbi:MAG: alpha/beta hydrolase [Ilumatobacteraceae bacterium]|nr:alpha/beta hydrolase [Ilumatobacteraceae bacterium]